MILTYTKYKQCGGKVEETAFSSLNIKAESKLHYRTLGRIVELETVPEAVYKLLTAMIDIYAESSEESANNNIKSYSNGIESISYGDAEQTESAINTKIAIMINEYLYAYPGLLRRR